MRTPIISFIKNYINSDISRFHMPGHKGKKMLGCEPFDITEIDGADVLYAPDGIIKESEDNISSLFGTAHTFYSTEGSTLAIKAMLAIATKGNKNSRILAARNVHKAFIYGAALLDLDVTWIYPDEASHICSCAVSPQKLDKAIRDSSVKPSAVYVTSPDYLGNILDIKGLSEICQLHNIPLLVDNAHGAYLAFVEPSLHPISLGAAMCCDSAHKTLPVLTGGAYLHISANAPDHYVKIAREAFSLFASTSPSYLILQSLDMCNKYLSLYFRKELKNCISKTNVLKSNLKAKGIRLVGNEPLKLTIFASDIGYTGHKLAEYLSSKKIAVEFHDSDYTVLMISPQNTEQDFKRLADAFDALKIHAPILPNISLPAENPDSCVSIRDALFNESETVATDDSIGRICASPTVSCPPAVPVIISGERITEKTISVLRVCGIKQIQVLK